MMVDVCRLSAAGDHSGAQDMFDAYLPLVRYEQQPGAGLAVRKYVLAKRGAIASTAQRRPGVDLRGDAMAEVEFLLERQSRRLRATTSWYCVLAKSRKPGRRTMGNVGPDS
jgi:4-hydroxy-tetrahydrodipicolinate synthase